MVKLEGSCIIVGVTGGIAVYKACEVVSRLKKLGATVHVVMTRNACEFVAPLTFETLSNNAVAVDTFAREGVYEVEHVSLAKKADLFLIAPATANIMAKMAHGIADDMLSTTVLATRAPILLAPAMNTGMWDNVATRENVKTLQKRGIAFVGPAGGHLACGDSGVGRMSEPCDIVEAALAILKRKQDFCGLRVLVTAGPTREKIDPVRFITNRSSGKMGYAIAQCAKKRGATVTLVSGVVALSDIDGVHIERVETTEQLYDAMMRLSDAQDIIIQAAAPADYKPTTPADQKIKKQAGETLTIELKETADVAAAVGTRKRDGQTLVAFAAETQNALENAQKKLFKKNADLVVVNDVTQPDAGFDVDTNLVSFVSKEGVESLPLLQKSQVADAILDKVLALRGAAM